MVPQAQKTLLEWLYGAGIREGIAGEPQNSGKMAVLACEGVGGRNWV